ncbi:MAG: hypothetical protein LBG43_10490 [Treponema sp.]|jgi:hypothetical protein|nr:hypothetical protein [Treponema sp.]
MERESALHHALKIQYAGVDGKTEAAVKCGGREGGVRTYICDGVTGAGEIIEVQTGSFAPLKEKMQALSREYRVRVIHPIVLRKHIELYKEDGAVVRARKSPAAGGKWDVFKALVHGWEIAALDNVCIELAFVDIAETRIDDGRGSWRRKGVSIADKRLLAFRASIALRKKADYLQFAPFAPEERWTAADLARSAKIRLPLAQKTVFVLTKLNVIARIGKKGVAWVYSHFQSGF